MKALRLNLVAMTVVVLAAQAFGQDVAVDKKTQEQAPVVKREIVVSLEDRKLALVEDGQVKKVYSVAVGKPSTPSPTGTFTIERRVMNPTYHHDGRTVPPGPRNPVGTRWMGLSVHGYGIHGTNEPKSIGKAASHGCIRMAKADLEEFYAMVEVGDTVELVGNRNEETARLFGDEEKPSAPAAQTVVAAAATPVAVPVQDAGGAEKANAETVPVSTLTAMR
jgi:lipoprotein-anchoring transpeptidase ErfK/SrfK